MTKVQGPKVDIRPRPEAVPVATSEPYSFVHINKCGGSSVEIALGLAKRHATAQAMRDEIGAETWKRRFSFSIVRNPFDRVVSLYYYRVRLDLTGLGDRHANINQWICALWQEDSERYNEHPVMNLPCAGWLVDGAGEILVDTVVRLEDIDTEWPKIANRLGVDIALARTNSNRRPSYRDVLTPESRAIIETAFAEDLFRFGYEY